MVLVRRLSPVLLLVACESSPATPGMPPLTADPAVATGCSPGTLAAGQVRAKVVECLAEVPVGRLAGGMPGDIVMENAKVRFVIRAQAEGFSLHGTAGGSVVDAALVDGEDLVKEIFPAVGFAVGAYEEYVITEAGDDGPAEVAMRGQAVVPSLLAEVIELEAPAVLVEQRYRLAADADGLEMITRLWPLEGVEGETTGDVTDALFFGGRALPFVPGIGYATGGSVRGPFVATDGTTTSYAIAHTADSPTVQLLDVDNIRLAIGGRLEAGGEARQRWLVLGDGSVASVAERAWTARGEALGTVTGTTAAGVNVVASDGEGAPWSVARAGADGSFRLALPAGTYQLTAEHLGRSAAAATEVTVTAGQTTQATVTAGAAGALDVSVADPDGGPLPARVRIDGASGGRVAYVDASGQATLPLSPGTYRVSVSRGMEYDAHLVEALVVGDDETVPLDVTLTRVVDTPGWVSADTHLHSEMSPDSTITLEDRLLAVAAEGVEVAVSTDHDFISDYSPVIDDLGLGAWVTSTCGEEQSSMLSHINAWPLRIAPERAGHGAVPWFAISPGEMFAALHAAGNGTDPVVVQINHPRSSTSGFFASVDFNRATVAALADPEDLGIPGADLNDFSFDAVEVGNCSGEEHEECFLDWLALVGAGHPAAATGSSDSHGPTSYAGSSRTYIYVGAGNDDPSTLDLRLVNDAILARRVTIGEGAFVTAGVVDPDSGAVTLPGDLADAAGAATVTLRVHVQAPPWMPLAKIRIYERSDVVLEVALDSASTAALRYQGDLTLPLAGADTFFVVRVDPAGPGDPVLGAGHGSFTNPVMVDADGDGVWEP